MNKQSSLGSILERAAEVYDFQAGFQARPVPPPAPKTAPPPTAAPTPTEPEPIAGEEMPWPVVEQRAAPLRREPRPAPRARQVTAPARQAVVDRALLKQNGFIQPDGPISVLAEEFRILKRQLLLGVEPGAAAKQRTILVCSAQPNDGKTFCAVNLALSMAGEKDLEILLIDGDFAKPEIPALLGVDTGPGFSDAIADKNCDVNSFVIQTDIKGLSLLPAGRRANDITELLASARTSEVLNALTEGHDNRILVFDSPPALVASPASVLASHAGQIMLVVRADQTTEGDLREALSLLSACDSISLMLNRASLAVSGRRFGSYYGQGE